MPAAQPGAALLEDAGALVIWTTRNTVARCDNGDDIDLGSDRIRIEFEANEHSEHASELDRSTV